MCMLKTSLLSLLVHAVKCGATSELSLVQVKAGKVAASRRDATGDALALVDASEAAASVKQGASVLAEKVVKRILGQSAEIIVEAEIMKLPVAMRSAVLKHYQSKRIVYQRESGIISTMSADEACKEVQCDGVSHVDDRAGHHRHHHHGKNASHHHHHHHGKKQRHFHKRVSMSLLQKVPGVSKKSNKRVLAAGHGTRAANHSRKEHNASTVKASNLKAEHLLKRKAKAAFKARKKEQQRLEAARSLAREAPLNDQGYLSVLAARDSTSMGTFVHRLLEREGLALSDEDTARSQLNDLIRFYSGECGNGTYNALIAELYDAAEPSTCGGAPLFERVAGAQMRMSLVDRWLGAEDRLPTWRWQRAEPRKGPVPGAHAVETATEVPTESAFVSFAGVLSSFFSSTASSSPEKAPSTEAVGLSAALSHDGYEAVVATANATEMAFFIRRVLVQNGLRVVHPRRFRQMLQFYDGECESQSYEVLVRELFTGVSLPRACGGGWVKPL